MRIENVPPASRYMNAIPTCVKNISPLSVAAGFAVVVLVGAPWIVQGALERNQKVYCGETFDNFYALTRYGWSCYNETQRSDLIEKCSDYMESSYRPLLGTIIAVSAVNGMILVNRFLRRKQEPRSICNEKMLKFINNTSLLSVAVVFTTAMVSQHTILSRFFEYCNDTYGEKHCVDLIRSDEQRCRANYDFRFVPSMATLVTGLSLSIFNSIFPSRQREAVPNALPEAQALSSVHRNQ